MDEQQVRALVRQAIARHLGPGDGPSAPRPEAAPASRAAAVIALGEAAAPGTISHAQFHLVRPAGEVECLIEPTVTCNHCGYCQCYGH